LELNVMLLLPAFSPEISHLNLSLPAVAAVTVAGVVGSVPDVPPLTLRSAVAGGPEVVGPPNEAASAST
jgi:hypothetical protein